MNLNIASIITSFDANESLMIIINIAITFYYLYQILMNTIIIIITAPFSIEEKFYLHKMSIHLCGSLVLKRLSDGCFFKFCMQSSTASRGGLNGWQSIHEAIK